ncbi:MAG: adenylyltransferase/cytidyltransferase family protein [Patescibacteria group bacterium]
MEEKIFLYDSLFAIRRRCGVKDIAFVSGTYDLLHPGHVHFFELVKEVTGADVLVVGVGCDADIKRYKGDARPIMDEETRVRLVAALEVVDYAFITHAPPEGQGHFLDGFIEIFQKLRPDYYVINSDTFDIDHRKKLAEQHGVKMVALNHSTTCPDCKGISASSIIQRILAAESADQKVVSPNA